MCSKTLLSGVEYKLYLCETKHLNYRIAYMHQSKPSSRNRMPRPALRARVEKRESGADVQGDGGRRTVLVTLRVRSQYQTVQDGYKEKRKGKSSIEKKRNYGGCCVQLAMKWSERGGSRGTLFPFRYSSRAHVTHPISCIIRLYCRKSDHPHV
jgi:hypothetical protein